VVTLRTAATKASVALSTTALIGLGISPAAASEPATVFEAAQQALDLDSRDAATIPGVDAQAAEGSAEVALGDFEVRIEATATDSDTTILPDGIRVMSLLEEGDSQTDFQLSLPDGALLVPHEAGYAIVIDAGGTRIALAHVAEPWAVDADGHEVSTSYALSGNVLTQRIEGDDIAYPVVADPTITVGVVGATDGPGAYWNMTGSQARAIAAVTATTLGNALAAGCVGAAKIPRVGYIIQGVCGYVGVPTLKNMWGSVTRIMRSTRVQNSACYQIKIVPRGTGLRKTARRNCA